MTITTTRGDMDETQLSRREGTLDSPTETVHWIEYRAAGEDEIIHRSVHIQLKETVSMSAATRSFN